MDVVYLFCEAESVNIPFYNYDKPHFTRLAQEKIGYWDHLNRRYVLRRGALSSETGAQTLARLFPETPYVFCENGPTADDVSATVHGFFGRPWNLPRESGFSGSSLPALPAQLPPELPAQLPAELPAQLPADTGSAANPQQQQNYFFGAWLERLETELHARKYSPRTIKSYRHYNQTFCNFAQKRPEEITSDDVARYISYLDCRFKFSASTMNMAISALKFFYHQIMNNHAVKEPHRPRADKKLPIVLSREEVQHLLDALENPNIACSSCLPIHRDSG
jgi:hypothetical protein